MNKIIKKDRLKVNDFITNNSIELPKIEEYKFGSLEIKKQKESFYMYVNSQQWMIYSPQSGIQLFEFYSHNFLSKGVVVCTGMGFLIRESWILKNPNVTKVIVVENSKDVIDYHKEKNAKILEKIEIIHGDANNLEIECDCLLVDHFEMESFEKILTDVVNLSKKINHKVLWFWSLEKMILAKSSKEKKSFLEIYNNIRQNNNLSTLPQLNKETLEDFIYHYFNPPFLISYD
jgi:hypothetical protein